MLSQVLSQRLDARPNVAAAGVGDQPQLGIEVEVLVKCAEVLEESSAAPRRRRPLAVQLQQVQLSRGSQRIDCRVRLVASQIESGKPHVELFLGSMIPSPDPVDCVDYAGQVTVDRSKNQTSLDH